MRCRTFYIGSERGAVVLRPGHKVSGAGLGLVSVASGEIHRWTDEHGKVHFSDRPPVEYWSDTVDVKINTYTSVSYDA